MSSVSLRQTGQSQSHGHGKPQRQFVHTSAQPAGFEEDRQSGQANEGSDYGNAAFWNYVYVLEYFRILADIALVAALRQLGYTPYDFIDRILLGQLPLWTQALRAKFRGQGKPWGKAEFDRVVKGFDCVLDVPCPFFTEEFLSAYPAAVVILNKRDPELWLASMQRTLFHVFSWRSWSLLAKLDPGFAGAWYTHCNLTWDIFCSNDYSETCKGKYLAHYDYVRRVTPKERLLEYEVNEGWEPLCRFLVKEVPEGNFPNVNDQNNFFKGHNMLWAVAVFKAIMNLLVGAASVLVVVVAWLFYRTR
ncbi:MAG: hypothetical protein Q9226_003651 [Calogaya cf. arnoldii]